MKIAVDTAFLLAGQQAEYGQWHHELLKKLAQGHPDHQFIFIGGQPHPGADNITCVNGGPGRHPLKWKWWYDVKLPALLKKYRADVFLACNGIGSLRTPVPQCLLIDDPVLQPGSSSGRICSLFYRYYTPRFLRRAAVTVTPTVWSKEELMTRYKIPAGRIDVVYGAAAGGYQPVSEEEQEAVRNRYTGGRNYFVYTGMIDPHSNLINLFKAFSVFKKRQQSNWKLVLAGEIHWPRNGFARSLDTYKYRDDVVVTGPVEEEERVKITGAAYAMVYPVANAGFGMPVSGAMAAGVPVVTSAVAAMQETGGDAALYADAADHNDLADKMMRLYKDEKLHKELIRKGSERAQLYTLDAMADTLWRSIVKCGSGMQAK